MANQTTNVNGSGYGSLIWDSLGVQTGDINNVYLDSLIWGVGWTDGNLNDPISASQSDPVSISYNILSATEAAAWFNDPATTSAFDFYDPDSTDFILAAEVLNIYEQVTNLEFTLVTGIADTNIVLTTDSWVYMDGALGFADVPNTYYDTTGVFINAEAAYYIGDGDFDQGSYNFVTLLHEMGHNMGLAHPHDGGLMIDASLFPGVVSPFDSYGDNDQNQGIYTTMSYNSGYALNESPSYNYGYEGTLMAYDVAALQHLYGVNTETRTDDDVYNLPTANGDGTFYSCIWDADGIDSISNEGASGDCYINLSYASLLYGDPNGGGALSFAYDAYGNFIHGGYTIANGILIENAVGGDGHDEIVGNFLNNNLIGGSGNDSISPGSGADDIDGGSGSDTVYLSGNQDEYLVTSKNYGSEITLTKTDDTNILTNIEYVRFADSGPISTTSLIDFGNFISYVIIDNSESDDLTQENLYKTASGAYVIDDLDLSPGDSVSNPITLAKGSKNYTFKTDPTGIVDNGLDQHYVYSGSGSKWTKEVFNSDTGQYVTKVKYTLSQLLTDESTYNLDFNGDGAIGDSIAYFYAESSWTQDLGGGAAITFAVGLYKTASGSYVLDNYGLDQGDSTESPVSLLNGTKAFSFKGSLTGVLDTFDYVDVYEQNGSKWTKYRFDDDAGIFQTKFKYSEDLVMADELQYNVDLNGDGLIG